jgi:hypothetical protein
MSIRDILPPIAEKAKRARATIIMGAYKTGKTILACSAQEIGLTLLMNFENRLSHIPETENLRFYPLDGRLCNQSDIYTLVNKINELGENHGITNIIIDTIDSMVYLYEREILRMANKKALGFELRKDLNNPIVDFVNFLKTKNINVIITCHEKESKTGNTVKMALPNDLSGAINSFVDDIFYLRVAEAGKRVLHLKNYEKVEQNAFSLPMDKIVNVPDYIEDPSFLKIMSYYD